MLLGFIPINILLAVLVIAMVYIILNHTVLGRHAAAIGTNPVAANISGLPVKKTILQLFLLNGFFVGVGVIIFTAQMGVGKAGLGENRTLDFVASVIIGGTSVFGGSATVLGTVLGAMFILLINNSLNMFGLSWYVIMIVKGTLVVVMALVDAMRLRKEMTR